MSINETALKAAQNRIKGIIHRSPILSSRIINHIAGAEVLFKCEGFQKTGSFKARGATNAVLQLSNSEAENGVATHSSGNHGQALAWAAQSRGIPAYIVMPKNAPAVKVAAVKAYGAEVIFCEPKLEARESGLKAVIEKTGATFVPPYNHPHIIEGQSTAAAELIEDSPKLDAIFAPVGGGGLLAGTALSAHFFSPSTKVFAGEPAGADDAYRSFYGGALIERHSPDTIADGLRTTLGPINFEIIKKHVSDIFTVSEEEIIAAMKLIYQHLKIVIEPSCAVPLAALLNEKSRFSNKRIGLILSGANVDLQKLPF